MTTGAPVLSGNDLRELRRGLNLSDDSFAQYLGVELKHYRKAERFKDEPIDSKKFEAFLGRLVYIAPQMVVAKMQAMQKIAEGLKFLGTKLQRTAKWLEFEKRGSSKGEAPAVEEEKEARVLEGGGVDKRTVHDLGDDGDGE
jgi:transcriptional regulator with XRE-family HTH domain